MSPKCMSFIRKTLITIKRHIWSKKYIKKLMIVVHYPSEASYVTTQIVRGVHENQCVIAYHPQHTILRTPQSVWVLPENTSKPSEASYVVRQNVWEGSTKVDFSSIRTFNINFIEGPQVCECCPKHSPNNKRTDLGRTRFIVVIWILLPKVLVLIRRKDLWRHRLLHQ